MTETELHGHAGRLHVRVWSHADPTHLVVLVHGYGEHIGRYDHVANAFVARRAAVYGLDHVGHGRSEGERALITSIDLAAEDLHQLIESISTQHSGLPIALVGHSMGGLIATRYAQLHGDRLAAVVLSAPLIGSHASGVLLAVDPLPEVPIDPAVLSRDESVQAQYISDPLIYHGPFKRPTLAAFAAALLDAALDAPLVTGPVLWQHGEADQLVPIDGSRRLIHLFTNAQVSQRFYPGARHEIFNETNHDQILADTTDYVTEVVRRSTRPV